MVKRAATSTLNVSHGDFPKGYDDDFSTADDEDAGDFPKEDDDCPKTDDGNFPKGDDEDAADFSKEDGVDVARDDNFSAADDGVGVSNGDDDVDAAERAFRFDCCEEDESLGEEGGAEFLDDNVFKESTRAEHSAVGHVYSEKSIRRAAQTACTR